VRKRGGERGRGGVWQRGGETTNWALRRCGGDGAVGVVDLTRADRGKFPDTNRGGLVFASQCQGSSIMSDYCFKKKLHTLTAGPCISFVVRLDLRDDVRLFLNLLHGPPPVSNVSHVKRTKS